MRLSRLQKTKLLIGSILTISLLLGITILVAHFKIKGDLEGIYILKGTDGKLFDVQDDVMLGEYERVLFKVDLPRLHALLSHKARSIKSEPYLQYTWNEQWGHGYIQNFNPDGTRFVICFSRFLDSNGAIPQGLFVGGGLPYSRYENSNVLLNETGVAFFKGSNWYHIWCNANEAVSGMNSTDHLLFPSSWKFLGSKIHYATSKKVLLQSSHLVQIDGVPFQIDRFVIYHAGNRYFLMANRFRNVGKTPASYYFVYGDEPWVGNYGSSGGNIGWTKDRLYYYESVVDPKLYSYAGMYDHGNRAVPGEIGGFTEIANFIEWMGEIRPDLVYFSNKEGKINDESARIPLASSDNRVIFLQWGPRQLLPNQSETILMAIGMADSAANTKLPGKPTIDVDWADMHYITTSK